MAITAIIKNKRSQILLRLPFPPDVFFGLEVTVPGALTVEIIPEVEITVCLPCEED